MVKWGIFISGTFLLAFVSCDRRDFTPCDDPTAFNYNPRATVNDGSCEYAQYNINPELITALSKEIDETSGLIQFEGHIWTHNDRGGENKLYSINLENGRTNKTIEISNAPNIDWEDIDQDSEHIYIGDFGNNEGNRRDLKVLKIQKNKINIDLEYQKVDAEEIGFFYPDQEDFSASKDHNFDCESLIVFEGNLYMFSKHRYDRKSNIYKVPALPGRYQAEIINSFHARGRITSAAISPNKKNVILLGYHKSRDVFLWILKDFQEDDFFNGNKIFVNLGPFELIGQAEGVCFISSDEILISSEVTENLDPKLYKISIGELLN